MLKKYTIFFAILLFLLFPQKIYATEITLNPYGDSSLMYDSMLYASDPNGDYSSYTGCEVGYENDGGKVRCPIKWDLSSIPSNAVIDSAYFHFNVWSKENNGVELKIARILSGNSNWALPATWNKRNTNDAWAGSAGASTAGTDFSTTLMADVAAGSVAFGWNSALLNVNEFTLMVANNYGMLAYSDDAHNEGQCKRDLWNGFNGSDNRHYLVVNYHVPEVTSTPTPTVTPTPLPETLYVTAYKQGQDVRRDYEIDNPEHESWHNPENALYFDDLYSDNINSLHSYGIYLYNFPSLAQYGITDWHTIERVQVRVKGFEQIGGGYNLKIRVCSADPPTASNCTQNYYDNWQFGTPSQSVPADGWFDITFPLAKRPDFTEVDKYDHIFVLLYQGLQVWRPANTAKIDSVSMAYVVHGIDPNPSPSPPFASPTIPSPNITGGVTASPSSNLVLLDLDGNTNEATNAGNTVKLKVWEKCRAPNRAGWTDEVAYVDFEADNPRYDTLRLYSNYYVGYGYSSNPFSTEFHARGIELPFHTGFTCSYPLSYDIYHQECETYQLEDGSWHTTCDSPVLVGSKQGVDPNQPNYDPTLVAIPEEAAEVVDCGDDIFCKGIEALKGLFKYLFVPKIFDSNQVNTLITRFNNKAPFGYITAIYAVDWSQLSNPSSDIPDFYVPIKSKFKGATVFDASINVTGNSLEQFRTPLNFFRSSMEVFIVLMFIGFLATIARTVI